MMKNSLRKITNIPLIKPLTLMALSLALIGCGFHLRGYEAETVRFSAINLKVATQTQQSPQWAAALKRALRRSGVTLSETAPLTLTVSDISTDKNIIAYDSRGKAAEYELTQSLSFHIIDSKQSKSPTHSATLHSHRVYTFDSNNMSGKNQEERLLLQEMRSELLRKLIFRLNQLPTKAHQT